MSNHSPAHPQAHAAASHGHGHSAHDVQKSVRKYMLVFVALLIGTVITVAVSYIHFEPHSINIAIGLFIAAVKAALVAGYFMHLFDERKLIYAVLGATIFFFIGLMYLTVWSELPHNRMHLKQ